MSDQEKVLLGKVALVGTGAIGCFYGGFLARAGQDVQFLFRSNCEEASSNGLRVSMQGNEGDSFNLKPISAHGDPGEIGICDWVIVAAKTTANEALPNVLRPLVGPETKFLTLQNGMGNVEWLDQAFGPSRLTLAGLCFTCCNRVSPCEVENYFPGYVQFGELGRPLSAEGRNVMNAFRQAGVQVKEASSLEEALWRKLCWNVPFSGLTVASGGITTDCILADKALAGRARSLMFEIQAAAAAHGVRIEEEFLDHQFTLTRPMGAYKPSSLIDFLDGREIEIEAIWGEPLRRGRSKEVPMPELEKLYYELLALR